MQNRSSDAVLNTSASTAAGAVVTAANVHDKHPLPDLLHGNERWVYGDSCGQLRK